MSRLLGLFSTLPILAAGAPEVSPGIPAAAAAGPAGPVQAVARRLTIRRIGIGASARASRISRPAKLLPSAAPDVP